jgi:hypothetical protein
MAEIPEHRLGALRRRTAAALGVLRVRFLIGMAVNRCVTIPNHRPGAGSGPSLSGALASVLRSFTGGLPLLIAHVVVGIVLLLNGIELVLHAVRRRPGPAPIWLAAVGLAALLFAGLNGASFLRYDQNISSVVMAVGFAMAVAC